MAIHISVLAYICCLGFFCYFNKKPNKKLNTWFTILALFAVFLVQALRSYQVGFDTYAYQRAFYLVKNGVSSTMTESWEPLFLLLNKVISIFTDNPQFLIAACSVVILTGIGIFVVENTGEGEAAFFPIFLFVCMEQYFSTMNLLRQSCAMAIAINIYTVLNKDSSKKGFFKAILLLLTAILFHRSAIAMVLIILLFMVNKITKSGIILLGFFGNACVLIFDQLLNAILRIFPYYAKYVGTRRFESNGLGRYDLLLIGIKILVILLVFTLDANEEKNQELYKLSTVMVFSVIMLLLQTQIAIANRVGYFYEIFFILLVPKCIHRFKAYKNQIYFGLIAVGWITFIYLMAFTNEQSRGCVPYYFFWE